MFNSRSKRIKDKIIAFSQQANGVLDLSNYGLSDNDMVSLVEDLNKYPNINSLNLRHNNIGDNGGQVLANLKHIVNLDLESNDINKSFFALIKNNKIKLLNVENNNISNTSLTEADAKFLHHTSLQLARNPFNDREKLEQINLVVKQNYDRERILLHPNA